MRNSSSMRQRKRNEKHREECNVITAAVPADIVRDVLKRMNPKEAVQLSSVCRYWRAPALACSPTRGPTPWMLALAQSFNQFRVSLQSVNHLHFSLQSIADASVFVDLSPVNASPGHVRFCGSFHGWLAISQARYYFFLLNPFSHVRISLPPHDRVWKFLCITSDPAAPGCAVIAHDFHWNLLVCKPGDDSWTKGAGVCNIGYLGHAVWLKEQLFVLNTVKRQLFILQLFPLQCKDIRQVSFCDCIDIVDDMFLVESEGDLLLFVIGGLEYMDPEGPIDPPVITVCRLDWDTMSFVAVESLGADRAVFLSEEDRTVFSVSAREAGCAADCIYLIHGCVALWRRLSWYCYNLKEGKVETVLDRQVYKFPISEKFWIAPTM